jgi:copper chaperone NosL
VRRLLVTLGLLALGVLALPGCGRTDAVTGAASLAPTELAGHECVVCGMVVSEQPAPRGQVVHRDGEHLFTCSLGDLRAYLQTPTARGEATGVWVEALPAGHDPLGRSPAKQPWVAAAQAHYVVGLDLPGIMGHPVLSFGAAATAEGALALPGARRVTWDQLLQTPFSRLPAP